MFAQFVLRPGVLLSILFAASAAKAELAIISPDNGKYYPAFSFASPTRISAPMKVNNGGVSTSVANQGSASTMVAANKGTYYVELSVRAPSVAQNSINVSVYPYGATGTFRFVEFSINANEVFQRVPGKFNVEKSGWLMVDLKGAEAGTLITKVRIVPAPLDLPAPAPAPAPQPSPAPTPAPPPVAEPFPSLEPDARELALNENIVYGGMSFVAQTKNILFDGASLRFRASTGEFAYFDPADGRKIRNEVCSNLRMEPGRLYTFEMDLYANGPKTPHTDLQWWAPVQIHAADTRDANGFPLPASPIFGMDLQPNAALDGYDIKVTAQTHTNMNGGFVAERLLGRVPFSMGTKHHVKIEIVDTHGGPHGLVRVTMDGVLIADGEDIPTGYAFVDTPVLYGGKVQPSGSYLKLGIYAGNQYRPTDVTLQTQVSNFSWSQR